jgi:hypothetical protein
MQLIQRTTLLFQDDGSDKVYEVDLVQTATVCRQFSVWEAG